MPRGGGRCSGRWTSSSAIRTGATWCLSTSIFTARRERDWAPVTRRAGRGWWPSSSRRAATDRAERVVGGVLVRLAQAREIEHRVDEGVDGAARLHHHEAHVHELGGVLPHDVHAEEGAGVRIDDELHLAGEIPHDLSARIAAVLRPPHAVGKVPLAARLLGLAYHRNF